MGTTTTMLHDAPSPRRDQSFQRKLRDVALELGFRICVEIPASHIRPEHRIRELCRENRCGNYGAHFMCPPHIGTIDELSLRVRRHGNALLLQDTTWLDVVGDQLAVRTSKLEFHERILRFEAVLDESGISEIWGLIGGDCVLCEPCGALYGEPCPHPDRARTSLEAIGVDVTALLDELKLDSQFRSDRVTWTGCVLSTDEPSYTPHPSKQQVDSPSKRTLIGRGGGM